MDLNMFLTNLEAGVMSLFSRPGIRRAVILLRNTQNTKAGFSLCSGFLSHMHHLLPAKDAIRKCF